MKSAVNVGRLIDNVLSDFRHGRKSAVNVGRLIDNVLSDFRHGRKSAVNVGRLIDNVYHTPVQDGSMWFFITPDVV